MHLIFRIFRLLAPICLGLGTMGAAPIALPREPELGGTYEDTGIVAIAPPGEPPPVVSLHALLTVEFMPGLVRILHDQTGTVRLTHTAGQLKVEITNRDGEVTWARLWKQGEDYAMREERVLLRFKPARFGDDEFVLRLETVTAYKLLQVEVQRHTPTILGPKVQPMGTYLFHRAE